METKDLKRLIDMAAGREPADIILRNAKIVNVFTKEIVDGDIAISDGIIVGVGKYDKARQIVDLKGKYVSPGFIDAHLHIESTMVMPVELAHTIASKGTTSMIADPHEIANVLDTHGIQFMLEQVKHSDVDTYIMLPSCVPSTPFENCGGNITASDISLYAADERILGLGEMMNYPGLISGDESVVEKILAIGNKIIDGHCPTVTGKDLQAYRVANVMTDHECLNYEEAKEKLRSGMYVLVREGSTARDLSIILKGAVEDNAYFGSMMFCTDDKKISDIVSEGHIDHNIRKAIQCGVPVIEAYCMATINPANCYNLKKVGGICAGFRADLIILNDLESVSIERVYKNGVLLDPASDTKQHRVDINEFIYNTVHPAPVVEEQLALTPKDENIIISLTKDSLYTAREVLSADEVASQWQSGNLCKLAVIERHRATGNIGLAYLKNYGLRSGAIASTVAHDSHNIVVAGANDKDMLIAIQELCKVRGGITVVENGKVLCTLKLPVAGIMSDKSSTTVVKRLSELKVSAHSLGIYESIEPFISLSFLALPVIPEIKLTDIGLFDVTKFEFIKD